MAPYDTRKYDQKRWDALVSISDGFESTAANFLAARQATGTVTLAAPAANVANAIARIDVGFMGVTSATSTVTIQNGGTTVFSTYLAVGNTPILFQPPLTGSLGNAMAVILSPGGGTATLNVHAGTVVPYPYNPS
jgi:hypothetical protein